MKNIKIHSFPRSGTNYVLFNLRNLLPSRHFSIFKSPEDQMTMDKNILQIIVLRNPLDCMLSAFAHGEELRPSGGTLDGAIRYLNKRYTDLMGECHKYFDNIDFYLFEDIDNVPLKIASNFVDIPQDYQPIIPTRNEKHIPSMVDSEFYAEIKKAKIDYSWYKDADEAYQSIINRLKNVGIIE